MQNKHRLFLLDGMALVYRAHFAFIRNPITNSKGENTSAAFGFTNTLLSILETENPTHLAVAFDTAAPTARHELYPKYKAQREAMPEELAAALPRVKALCEAFRIPIIEKNGYEADDLIGTLAHQAEASGEFETYMVTPDKDFAQLVAPHTLMWKPGRKGNERDILGIEEIKEQWQVETPSQVIDILGLWGDASDNIPGVPGVGEKTAKKLVGLYGSVEGLLENTDKLKGKQKENVENNREQALLSKQLATIIIDAPVDHSPYDLIIRDNDEDTLKALFEDLEFKTLAARALGKSSTSGQASEEAPTLKTINEVKHTYHLANTPARIKKLLEVLSKADSFCFDVETTSLDRFESQLLGIAFSIKAHQGWYLPYDQVGSQPGQLDELKNIFANQALKIGHNLKFDLAILLNHDIDVAGPFFDTMLAHILWAPGQKHTMDHLSESLLSYSPVKLQSIVPDEEDPSDDLFTLSAKKSSSKKGDLNMAAIPLEKLAEYAAEDADVTFQLFSILREKLKDESHYQVLTEIESPLLVPLVHIEAEGIAIDSDALSGIGKKLQIKIDDLTEKIRTETGRDFNLNSPKQLGEILFGEMKLVEKPKKTKTGQFKTDEQTLASLAPKHPVVAHILDYREATKLKSTYVDALPGHIAPSTGRVHTHLHQLLAGTGRLASSDPNLQNIPVRSEAGREIRKAFVPRQAEGREYTLLAADYSQVELRVMAALSGDPAMIQAFHDGLDIHSATAARIHGVETDEVTSDMRRVAKTVNFGIIYGISAFGLSQRLGIPRSEAAEIIETYFEQYPLVKKFMEQTIENAREKGYVETLAGRRRFFKDINSSNGTIRANAERAAINSPIQGTAADMIKLAMIKVHHLLKNYRSKMLLQVHDELLFDLDLSEKDELLPLITQAMTTALPLPGGVPVKVDLGTGDNWLEAH